MGKRLKAKSLFDLRFVSDPQIRPDGRKVAAVVTRILPGEKGGKNPAPPEYKRRIHLFNPAGEEAEAGQAFSAESADSHLPRWSPDGTRLAFLSKRNGDAAAQLYLLPTAGGEAERKTELKSGVSGFAWRPDGEALAFVSRGDWQDEDADKGRGRLIDRLYYKANSSGFRAAMPAQLFLLELATGECTPLTDHPADIGDPVWAPDGETLFFTAARDQDDADFWRSRLWSLKPGRLKPGGKPSELKGTPPRAFQPQPSPKGTRLAFFAPTDEDNLASPTGLWTLSLDGVAEAVLHSGELEAVPAVAGDSRYGHYANRAVWLDEGALLFNANQEGRSLLHKLTLGDGKLRAVHKGDRTVTAFSYAQGVISFTAETPETPGELFVRRGSREKRLSDLSGEFLKTYRIAQVSKERKARSKDGSRVPYWTLESDKPRKDGALVLQVHGGPHTNYGYGFMLEFQFLAAQGYTVVYGNPRGSSSYGAAYSTTMQGRYGSVDAEDVLAVAHDARKRHAKPNAPIHLTGGSYGGFMTNWLVGHSDMFRSAVTQRSICNWLSFYGASDIGYWFNEQEVGGNAWDDTEKLWAQSPLKYVANIDTPLLIIHSEEDHRCPIEQAEQLFVALKRLGKTSKLLRFPEENHELSRSGRPDRRIERLEAILDWFEAHA